MSHRITGTTVLTGLLGRPVSHSISPLMHNESFRLLDLDYRYLCFDVGTEELKTAVQGLKTLGARGWNLTMPCKNLMGSLCDRLSPASEISGAVNTVVNDHGFLTGYTTDGIGYMKSAEAAGHPLPGKIMTLLGGGGAGTAILVQAALDGMKEIRVFNNKGPNYDRLKTIASRLKKNCSCKVLVYDLQDHEALLASIQSSHILTNATSVGMAPNVDACLIEDESCLRPDLIVSDIIYNPAKTRLLQMAQAAGCPTFNGMYMLLYQGAASFELWTGQPMPVERIKKNLF